MKTSHPTKPDPGFTVTQEDIEASRRSTKREPGLVMPRKKIEELRGHVQNLPDLFKAVQAKMKDPEKEEPPLQENALARLVPTKTRMELAEHLAAVTVQPLARAVAHVNYICGAAIAAYQDLVLAGGEQAAGVEEAFTSKEQEHILQEPPSKETPKHSKPHWMSDEEFKLYLAVRPASKETPVAGSPPVVVLIDGNSSRRPDLARLIAQGPALAGPYEDAYDSICAPEIAGLPAPDDGFPCVWLAPCGHGDAAGQPLLYRSALPTAEVSCVVCGRRCDRRPDLEAASKT